MIPKEKILDGKALSKELQEEIRQKVASLPADAPKPGLHVILVGDDEASHIYVRNKIKTCEKVGFNAKAHILPASTSAGELKSLINDLNLDDTVHGILLQLPLPDHLDVELFLNLIYPKKDVDGFHLLNVGKLWNRKKTIGFVPCTALGVLRLLEKYQIPLKGKHVVVVGQSPIVGRPTAGLFAKTGATVTLCHRFSKPLEKFTSLADILVVAAGVRHLIKKEHISEGCIIIDVGIHRTEDGLIGDVDLQDVLSKAGKITPVPGGVGPMTIACLLENTWKAYEQITKNPLT